MIGYDGTYTNDDYPGEMPELAGPPPPKRRGFTWTPPADALSREQYLAIGRPILVAAGFLKPPEADDKPPLPKMPDTPRKRRVAKPKPTTVVKPVDGKEIAAKVPPKPAALTTDDEKPPF